MVSTDNKDIYQLLIVDMFGACFKKLDYISRHKILWSYYYNFFKLISTQLSKNMILLSN